MHYVYCFGITLLAAFSYSAPKGRGLFYLFIFKIRTLAFPTGLRAAHHKLMIQIKTTQIKLIKLLG